MKTFEQKQLIERAQIIVDKYNEYNINTVEVTKSYNPKMKLRILQKIIIDQNAYKMSSFLSDLNYERRTEEKRIKRERASVRKTKQSNLPGQSKNNINKQRLRVKLEDVSSLYYRVGNDYFNHKMEVGDIVKKYNTTLHSVRQFVYKYARKNGIVMKRKELDSTKVNEIVALYISGISICEMEKKLKLSHRTIKRVLVDNNIEMRTHHSRLSRTKN
ncbi:hypothetical protein [Elizabethkingia ursingii]|uniref:hypothetical protein n=1 Tax=Elizabethkingia ursingii TaxID=1756150 RepID=UPI0020127EC6|nr:hypothetical protein [Elizabethkingia ursingii]MCL1673604.1 hypothetical protein [Elizabethkingia ursingii]